MSSDQDRVIVTTDASGPGVQVHHREFPEIRAEGSDAKDAAVQLSNHLTRALDSALVQWRRDAIESAIKEVKAFAEAPTAG